MITECPNCQQIIDGSRLGYPHDCPAEEEPDPDAELTASQEAFQAWWSTTPKGEPLQSIGAWKAGWDAALAAVRENVIES